MRILVSIIAATLLLTAQLCAQSPSNASASSQRASGLTRLELGKPIERELSGGETHSYTVRVEAGQFVHAVVLQKGIDVTVTLLDPSGKEVASANSLNGSYGPEPISAIAEVSGDFRMQVAASDAPTGRYEVQLTNLEAPTESDRTRIKAEHAYMEGISLLQRGDDTSLKAATEKWQESSLLWQTLRDQYGQALSIYSCGEVLAALGEKQEALDRYDQALALWRTIADRHGEVMTLNSIAVLYSRFGQRREALDFYAQVLALQHALGDRANEAMTLMNMGSASSALGGKQKALDYYGQAQQLFRALEDRDGEAGTLNSIGMIYNNLGEKQKALDSYAEALSLVRAVGDRDGEATILNNMGSLYSSLGEKQKALDYDFQALQLRRAVGDRAGEAATLNNIGTVYNDLGGKQKALDYHLQTLQLRRALGDHAGEAITLNNLGTVSDDLGEKQKALDYYAQALPLFHALGDRVNEAITLSNIGKVYDDLGEQKKALDYYAQALPLLRALEDRHGEATALSNMGRAYDNLGDKQKALDCYAQALALSRALEDPSGEATALNNAGEVYGDLGDKQKALDYYAQALPLRRSAGDRGGEAFTLSNMGQVYFQLGDMPKALDSYNQALSIFRMVRDPLGEAGTLLNLMGYWEALNRPSLAILLGKQGIDRLQQVRRNIQGLPKEEQQSFVKSYEDFYRRLAALLIQDGRLPEAQEVLDLLKLEEYSEYSHHRGASDSTSGTVTFTRDEKTALEAGDSIQTEVIALSQEWDELNRKSSRTPEEQARYDDLTKKLIAANRRMQGYFNTLYEDFGKGDQANKSLETARGESSVLQNLLRGMAPGTVGLYTLVLDQKSVILVITPAAMVPYDLPITKTALRAKVFDFVGALAAHRSEQVLLPKAQDLYKTLIAPIENDLAAAHATTLVWSLDDFLRYVPLAALHDGKQYLAERYSNVVLTTTSIGNLKDAPQVAAWRGLAMGVSKDYDGGGELAAVPGELGAVVTSAAVKGSHGPVPGTIMLNDSFTEKSMESALSQPPPLIHIATHFVFSPGDDEKSYLLLGGKDEGGKGYHLSLADLRDDPRMNFSGVELLTLSSCQTAMGSKVETGRDVDSLGIVGQMKGAKAVLATLWKVDDASVGILMEAFYRLWTTKPGMTKSEALRQAQLTLLRGATGTDSGSTSSSANKTAPYSNPYYWAPFILIGNWK